MTLTVEETEATGAVQAALSKRILVDYVTGGRSMRIRNSALLLTCAAAFLLATACGLLYWRYAATQARLQSAQTNQSRISQSLSKADAAMTTLENQVTALEKIQNTGGHELQDELTAARNQLTATEKNLAKARQQITELERTVHAASGALADVAAARNQLAAVQDHENNLEKQLQAEQKKLESQTQVISGLTKSKQELATELDAIKSQLLAQAAKTEIPAVSTPGQDDAPAPPPTQRWALRMPYDQATDFIALHFTPNKTTTAPGAEQAVVTTAVLTANAATLRMTHDAQNQRVYAATLTLSLAADAPPEKLAENTRLVAAFAQAFAPGLLHADEWAANAVKQLAAKDSSERLSRIGADYKLTVWNGGEGMYSWKVESPHGELLN